MSDAAPGPRVSASLSGLLCAIFVISLAASAVFGVMFDVFAAGRRPFVVLGLVVFFGLPSLIAVLVLRRKWMTWSYAAAMAVLAVLVFTPWHPRKRFVRDVDSLQPGMTVDEVEAVMGRYIKGAGAKWEMPAGDAPPVVAPGEKPDKRFAEAAEAAYRRYVPPVYPTGPERERFSATATYRWCDDDAAYHSDWGVVTFKDGRVVTVQFMPD